MKFKTVVLCLIFIFLVILTGGCRTEEEATPANKTAKTEIVFAIQRDFSDTYMRLVQDFSDNSPDTTVKLVELCEGGQEFYRMLSSILTGGEVQLDLCMIEDIWLDSLIEDGHLMPLDFCTSIQESDYPEPIRNFAVKKNRLYAIPLELDVGVLYYRNDILGQNIGMEDILHMEGADCAVCESDGEDMICRVIEFINYTGDIEAGLQQYKALAVCGQGKEFLDFKQEDAACTFSSTGKMREIINGYNKIQGKVASSALFNSSGQSCAVARIYGIAASSRSEHTENIKEFLSYMCSESVQTELIKGRSAVPVKYSQFEDAMILDINPLYKTFQSTVDQLYYRRATPQYTKLSEEAQQSVRAYLADDRGLEAAAEALAELLGRAG